MRIFILLIAVLLIFFLSFNIWAEYGTIDTVQGIRVADTDRVCSTSTNSDGVSQVSCKYLIFGDVEVFENTDTLFHFKFNSSDLQAKALTMRNENLECTFKVNKFRVPFLSMYRNVLAIDCPKL